MKAFVIWIGSGIAALVGATRAVFRSWWRAARAICVAAWRSRLARFTGRTALASTRVAATAGVVAGLTLGAGWLCVARVPPGYVGVRQQNFGQGIVPEDFGFGFHFSLRGLDQWHLVERGTQVISFAWESEGGDYPMLNVRTKDGNTADVALSVPYRVKPGEAHRLVLDGLKNTWKLRVRDAVEKVMLEELAHLSSEDMADTDARLRRCAAALPALDAALAPIHVEAERILITQVMFALAYEQKLQQRQRSGQEQLVAAVTAQVDGLRLEQKLADGEIDQSCEEIRARMSKEIEDVYAEGRRKIFDLQMAAREYDRRRRAEAQAEHDRLLSEGERATLRAEQRKDELANEVYDSAGGRLMLATQAAANLNIRQVTLNSNDPRVPSMLDLDELVRLVLGAEPR